MSNFNLDSLSAYKQAYSDSIKDPKMFWDGIANNFSWYKKWDKVLEYDFLKPDIKWFQGAKLNITENCIDRHLPELANKTAIIFEPNHPSEETQRITYGQLHDRVCQMANVLKDKGIKKGDRVCLYLPMIPELAIAVLACARIGAIHSVVFAGFSATALATRINDSNCKLLITSDGSFRGDKIIPLKEIVDNALDDCPDLNTVLVAKRTKSSKPLTENRDFWLDPLLENAEKSCTPEPMDAEDPLFILYTSGSTGKPKGMVHSTAGYMIYTAYTFANVFQYKQDDVYWCTADIGWITGHSYIVYGPLANGATTVMYEGVPNFPDWGRFWEIVDKLKITHFYTAPTAIRAIAKEGTQWPNKYRLDSLKVLGTVGEPINEEAWSWYNQHIGKSKCPIVDTWWQTETGGILLSSLAGITKDKPTYATLPMPGVQPVLLDENGLEIDQDPAKGSLCIKFPWPAIARTIWGDHERYKNTYFTAFPGYYFTGDGALRDENKNYRITGRIDDVIIVSGHNLGTAPIEDAINEHPLVAESALVGIPHNIKGNSLYGFVILTEGNGSSALRDEINGHIANNIGPIAKLDHIQFTSGLPKTRSGKIMRRLLRKIASKETDSLGDTSTLLNPEVVEELIKGSSL